MGPVSLIEVPGTWECAWYNPGAGRRRVQLPLKWSVSAVPAEFAAA